MPQPTRPTRHTAVLVLALALALALGLLGGCGGDGGGDGGDTGAATASTAESGAAASSPAPPQSSVPQTPVPQSSVPQPSVPDDGETRTIAVTEGEMYIEPAEDALSPGTYTLEVTNAGTVVHDLVVERDGEDVARTSTIPPGGTETLEVTLEEGSYVLYCSIGSHRVAGMEADVTVTA